MPLLPETLSFVGLPSKSAGTWEMGLKLVVTGLFFNAGDGFPTLGGNGFPWPLH